MDLRRDLRILLEKAIEIIGSEGSTGRELTANGFDLGTRNNLSPPLQKVLKHQWLLLILPLLRNHPQSASGSPGVSLPRPQPSFAISGFLDVNTVFRQLASGNEMQPTPCQTLNANPRLLTYFCDNQRKYLSLKFIIIA